MLTKLTVIIILHYIHLSLCRTPKTKTMSYIDYLSIKQEKKLQSATKKMT